MVQNRADVAIPQAVIDDVTAKLNDIKQALAPYVVNLTDEERKNLLKMSDKSHAFVGKVVDYTETNGEFIPSFLSKDDLKIDYDNFRKLDPLKQTVAQVFDNISDTQMISGNEAFMQSLVYYNSVKYADKNGIANARSIYEDLSQRFPSTRKRASTEAKG